MSASADEIILVNAHDEAIGTADKLTTHQQGLLHRAFSVFIFRRYHNQLQLLLQQRHAQKYHCGGLWTNTCCSHPKPDESIEQAAQRRLQEEMGFCTALQIAGSFIYKATLDNDLIEHELDHVLTGWFDGNLKNINSHEVAAIRWSDIATLKKDLQIQPNAYTPWLRPALELALNNITFIKI